MNADLSDCFSQAIAAPPPRSPDPEVVKIGAVFALYALYKAQRTRPIVRIYVPLQLLGCLRELVGRCREADAILRRLAAEDAFLYGAVRRPISGTAAARSAGMPVHRCTPLSEACSRSMVQRSRGRCRRMSDRREKVLVRSCWFLHSNVRLRHALVLYVSVGPECTETGRRC